jgi:hypothetical protein
MDVCLIHAIGGVSLVSVLTNISEILQPHFMHLSSSTKQIPVITNLSSSETKTSYNF